MDLQRIKELIELVKETGIAELEVGSGAGDARMHVRISRAVPAQAALAPVPAQPTENTAPAAVDKPGATVAAPLSGTFYRAPAPGEPAFVEVGDQVVAGDVLCIIESMKMMNQVKSEHSGELTQVLVDNGTPIETGAALFRIL